MTGEQKTRPGTGDVAAFVAGIEDAAKLPARIESLRLGFFPSPSVAIEGLAIAQPAGYGEGPFITVGELRLRIPWSGIFGVSEVAQVDAADATVRLVVNPDGSANWTKLGGEPVAGGLAREPVGQGDPGDPGHALRCNRGYFRVKRSCWGLR